MYIDPCRAGGKSITDPETGSERIYLLSRVAQNRYLGEDYVLPPGRKACTSELVKAWLEGDWTVIAGAFFPRVVIRPAHHRAARIARALGAVLLIRLGIGALFTVHWWAVFGQDFQAARGALV